MTKSRQPVKKSVLFRIAIAGKGGTGKTTLAALICRGLVSRGVKPLLAVDADPNSCLAERLGVTVERTIGELREELRDEPEKIPKGISKREWIERLINQEVAESIGFDAIVMGRQEGPDCYCYLNNLLRSCLEKIAGQYRAVVIDNEAGLEHLSRRTNGRVEVMLVVCEPTLPGARTAIRITEMMKSLKLEVERAFIVLNRCRDEIPALVKSELKKTGLETIARIPEDAVISRFELENKPLVDIPDNNRAVAVVDKLLDRLET